MTNIIADYPSVLVGAEELHRRLVELADLINSDYSDREIDLVCLSNGALVFMADLSRLIRVPSRQHLMAFSAYSTASQSGEVRLTLDVGEPLQDRHVLLIEGMVISGRTPAYIMNMLRLRCPASLELCAIGMKPAQLAVDLKVRYHLFDFDQEWVVGYGIGNGSQKASETLLDIRA